MSTKRDYEEIQRQEDLTALFEKLQHVKNDFNFELSDGRWNTQEQFEERLPDSQKLDLLVMLDRFRNALMAYLDRSHYED